jgi:hypothetical protein
VGPEGGHERGEKPRVNSVGSTQSQPYLYEPVGSVRQRTQVQRPQQRHMRHTGVFALVINRPVHLRAAGACVCYRTEKTVLSKYSLRTESSTP